MSAPASMAPVGEFDDEIRGLFEFGTGRGREQTGAAEFMTVHADHDPVGLAARLADPAQIVLQVAFVDLGRDGKPSLPTKRLPSRLNSADLASGISLSL